MRPRNSIRSAGYIHSNNASSYGNIPTWLVHLAITSIREFIGRIFDVADLI